ncbi:hypothetical protein U9M48_042310 [Paspalum notatum var. saurae]|uniref:Uncharacterized protein n=1 Tax=Paspalum notatum var. saurae TaxID=547442 RepID=A0AAQ3UQA5_PASNO
MDQVGRGAHDTNTAWPNRNQQRRHPKSQSPIHLHTCTRKYIHGHTRIAGLACPPPAVLDVLFVVARRSLPPSIGSHPASMGRGGVVSGGANAAAAGSSEANSVRLLAVSWNQDNTCFTAATTADLRVFTCAPSFQEKLRRVLPGGFAVAEILFRAPIFAVVAAAGEGGGANRVMVRDDSPRPSLFTDLDFPSAVRGVRLSRDYLAVVLDTTVSVYNLCDCACAPTTPTPTTPTRPLWKIETAPNARGLCCLSCHADSSVLACPGTERGQVRVQNLRRKKKKTFIAAHTSDLACMAMAADGAVLATASVKGTLVRVFNAMDGTCLQEVRRGRDQADIYSIALSPELQWLAVCSDKGTLHVFRLRVAATGDGGKDGGGKQSAETAAARSAVQANTASNARSSLSFMKVILPDYFSSEWSFAQFRLPETTRYVVAFGQHNTVMIIGMDGRCSFDPVNGKEMVRNEYFRFINDKDSPPAKTLAT